MVALVGGRGGGAGGGSCDDEGNGVDFDDGVAVVVVEVFVMVIVVVVAVVVEEEEEGRRSDSTGTSLLCTLPCTVTHHFASKALYTHTPLNERKCLSRSSAFMCRDKCSRICLCDALHLSQQTHPVSCTAPSTQRFSGLGQQSNMFSQLNRLS